MSGLDLAMIGNCTWGGLLDPRGRLVWACLPRFDSDPLFPALLDGDGRDDGVFAIELADQRAREQHYDGNTPILVTTLRDASGGAIEIRDFAPRYLNHGRFYRPTMMVRRVRPLTGEPRIRIVLRPRCDYGAGRPAHHARQQPPALRDAAAHAAPDHRRADLVRRRGDLVRAPAPDLDDPGPRRAARGVDREQRARPRGAHARPLGGVGAVALDSVRVAGRGDPRGDRAEAVLVRGDRRDRRGAHHLDPRGARQRPQLGLSLLLAARRLLRDPGAQSPRRDAHDGELPVVHLQSRRHRGRRRAPAALRDRARRGARGERGAGARRATAGWGRCASATRRSASSRTTSTAASCSRPRSRSSTGACCTRAATRCSGCSRRSASTRCGSGTGPTPASGSSARASRCTRSPR